MRICVRKSDSRIIEAQSGAGDGDLIANEVRNGRSADLVREEVVTDEEFRVRIASQNNADMTSAQKRARGMPSPEELFADLFRAGRFSASMTTRIQAINNQFPE